MTRLRLSTCSLVGLLAGGLVAQAGERPAEPPRPEPARAAEGVAAFVAACKAGDAAAAAAALVRVAAAPDAPSALATLRSHAADVPLQALVPFTTTCADLLPWGAPADRAGAVELANTIEGRAGAFLQQCGKAGLPELASQLARVFARGMVDGKAPIEALQKQVDDAFEQVREAACEALARRGAEAMPAVDALVHLLTRELPANGHSKLLGEYFPMQDQPRHAAARALVAIAPRDLRSVAAYTFLLQHGVLDEARGAAVALGGFGADAREAVPALVRALDATEPLLVRDAIVALGQIGPVAAAAVPKLEALASGSDKAIAAIATATLRQLRKAAKG